MIGREDEVRDYRGRVNLFHVVIVLMFSIILARLTYLQVLKGDELRKFSEANRLKKEKLPPARGIIYDREGKVIVDNRAAFDVVLLTQYYPFTDEVNARLAKALGIPLKELEKKLERADRTPRFYPTLLKGDASKDTIAAIEMDAEGFPGVDIEATVQRRYPYGDVAAQLLGYIGEVTPNDIKNDTQKNLTPGDYIGKMGIERKYDSYLRGQNGIGYVEVDANGRRKKTEGAEKLLGFVAQTDPVAGENLQLTLDADLEVAAAQALKSRGFNGSVVAIDPRSGEVLALVNEPSYDPGLISGRDVDPKVWASLATNKDRPLRDRAIQDHYPPGSTFKLFLAIAGMAEGIVNAHTTMNCPGFWVFGNRKFNCWQHHGAIDFIGAIWHSCDVFFYHVGNDLGVDLIAKWARAFGLGSPTGIAVPGESRGNIPDSAWKERVFHDPWHPGETLSVSIGQGYVDVTPIQLAAAYAAIANGGFLYKPLLVRKIVGRNGEVIKEFQPELTRKIELPQEVFAAVKEGMYRVVNEPGGTAFLSKSKLTVMSGKTGTAQVKSFSDIMKVKSCMALPVNDRHHAWFVGYAPRENPEIAIAVIAEHGCHGYLAGRVAHDVIDAYMTKKMNAAAKATASAGPRLPGVLSGVDGLLEKPAEASVKSEAAKASVPAPAAKRADKRTESTDEKEARAEAEEIPAPPLGDDETASKPVPVTRHSEKAKPRQKPKPQAQDVTTEGSEDE